MRVLLDECLPKRLKAEIVADIVQTVPEAGWAGKQNGELLRLAEQDFDVLVTNDPNIQHQQDISRFDLAFVVLIASTNDIVDLLPLIPELNLLLPTLRAGTLVSVR